VFEVRGSRVGPESLISCLRSRCDRAQGEVQGSTARDSRLQANRSYTNSLNARERNHRQIEWLVCEADVNYGGEGMWLCCPALTARSRRKDVMELKHLQRSNLHHDWLRELLLTWDQYVWCTAYAYFPCAIQRLSKYHIITIRSFRFVYLPVALRT
jgi:hypothetical protein